jgi:hypothetical protein
MIVNYSNVIYAVDLIIDKYEPDKSPASETIVGLLKQYKKDINGESEELIFKQKIQELCRGGFLLIPFLREMLSTFLYIKKANSKRELQSLINRNRI